MLQSAGFKVVCHVPTFDKEEVDDVWIRECARRDWVILTCDKNIENDPINCQAVIESKARIFFLDEGSVKAVFWAAAIIVSRLRLFQVILNNKGPYFANIGKETGVLVTAPRDPREGQEPKPSLGPTSSPNRANEWFKTFVKL